MIREFQFASFVAGAFLLFYDLVYVTSEAIISGYQMLALPLLIIGMQCVLGKPSSKTLRKTNADTLQSISPTTLKAQYNSLTPDDKDILHRVGPFIGLIAIMMLSGLIGGLYLFIFEGTNPTNLAKINRDALATFPTPNSPTLSIFMSLILFATFFALTRIFSPSAKTASIFTIILTSIFSYSLLIKPATTEQLVKLSELSEQCPEVLKPFQDGHYATTDYTMHSMKRLLRYTRHKIKNEQCVSITTPKPQGVTRDTIQTPVHN